MTVCVRLVLFRVFWSIRAKPPLGTSVSVCIHTHMCATPAAVPQHWTHTHTFDILCARCSMRVRCLLSDRNAEIKKLPRVCDVSVRSAPITMRLFLITNARRMTCADRMVRICVYVCVCGGVAASFVLGLARGL